MGRANRQARRPLAQRHSEGLEPRVLLASIYVDAASQAPVADGSSWRAAYHDLQLALAAARPGDSIRVAGGTYLPTSGSDRTASFTLAAGVALYGGYAGNANLLAPDTRDRAAYETILSGQIGNAGYTGNSYHVVTTGPEATASTILDGFTITAGHSTQGAGMYIDGGSPTIRTCTFHDNWASDGGALYISHGAPAISDSAFTYNYARNGNGGGIYNSASSPIVSGCSFTKNNAASGGAIYNLASSPQVNRCTFTMNDAYTASDGTIIYIGWGTGGAISSSQSSVSLRDSVFNGNTAPSNEGTNSGRGGAIFNEYESPLTAINCIFADNSAARGGALFGDSITLAQCTINSNGANSGRAIYSEEHPDSVTITNSILWGPSTGQVYDGGSGSIHITHSIIHGGYSGTGNIDQEPGFVRDVSTGPNGQWQDDDDDYGDLRLQPGSPAINSGNSADVPAGVTTDIAAAPRISGGTVDMGAYEMVEQATEAHPPTDITLSMLSIVPGQVPGPVIGTLSTVDPDANDVFTYSLVEGDGSNDNSLFAIAGSTLVVTGTLNPGVTYSIRIRTTDQHGLSFEKPLAVTIPSGNQAPTDLSLVALIHPENEPVGTIIGSFYTSDPDGFGGFAYTLVPGEGSADSASFAISGNMLQTTAILDYEAKPTYSIRVRTTDSGGLFFEKSLTITITDLQEFGLQQGKLRRATLTDGDGDLVTFSLTGGGSGTIQSDGRLTLTNTAAKSVLTISVQRGRNGDGYYGDDSGPSNLSGLPGISADGLLKSIVAPRVSTHGIIELNTNGTAAGKSTTTVRLGTVADASINTNGVPIRSLTVLNWMDWSGAANAVTAPWIGSIAALGQGNMLDSGSWQADVVTTSSNHGVAIGSLKVAECISDANIWASGTIGRISARSGLQASRVAAAAGIGSISAGEMVDSDILVGIAQDFTGHSATSFANPAAKLGKLTIAGQKLSKGQTHPAYVTNSHISAGTFGTITLTNVPADSAPLLHLASDTGTLRLKSLSPDMLPAGTWKAGQTPKPGHERPNLVEVVG